MLNAIRQKEFDFVVSGGGVVGEGRGWSERGLERGLEGFSEDFFGFSFAARFRVKVKRLGGVEAVFVKPKDVCIAIGALWGTRRLGWHGGKRVDGGEGRRGDRAEVGVGAGLNVYGSGEMAGIDSFFAEVGG